jgi:hypothetical protein
MSCDIADNLTKANEISEVLDVNTYFLNFKLAAGDPCDNRCGLVGYFHLKVRGSQ